MLIAHGGYRQPHVLQGELRRNDVPCMQQSPDVIWQSLPMSNMNNRNTSDIWHDENESAFESTFQKKNLKSLRKLPQKAPKMDIWDGRELNRKLSWWQTFNWSQMRKLASWYAIPLRCDSNQSRLRWRGLRIGESGIDYPRESPGDGIVLCYPTWFVFCTLSQIRCVCHGWGRFLRSRRLLYCATRSKSTYAIDSN